MKGRDVSIPGIVGYLAFLLVERLIFRPFAAGNLVKAGQVLPHAVAVYPEIRQNPAL